MICSARRLRSLSAGLMFIVALSCAAFADGRDRTQVGSNISIGPDEEVNEATCFGCSIRVRGHVSGDVTAFGGSVVVEDQGQVGGDTTVFGGDVRIDREVKLGGDVTVFGGRIRRVLYDHVHRTRCRLSVRQVDRDAAIGILHKSLQKAA